MSREEMRDRFDVYDDPFFEEKTKVPTCYGSDHSFCCGALKCPGKGTCYIAYRNSLKRRMAVPR